MSEPVSREQEHERPDEMAGRDSDEPCHRQRTPVDVPRQVDAEDGSEDTDRADTDRQHSPHPGVRLEVPYGGALVLADVAAGMRDDDVVLGALIGGKQSPWHTADAQ